MSSEGNEVMALDSQEISKCCIVPTSIQPSDSTSLPSSPPSPGPSNKPISYPILIVPELAIAVEAQPKWLIQPGGGKNYRCQLCAFQHTNRDCMLTHIRKHLDITIGCPVCGKGFQNAASLCKHSRKAHAVQIVASVEEQ